MSDANSDAASLNRNAEVLPTTGLPAADWRANYYWRAFATFLGFLGFGTAAIVASILTVLVLLIPGSQDVRQRRMRLFVHYLFKTAIGYFRLLGLLRYEVRGDKAELRRPGTVVVVNHPSLIDTVFMMSFIPNINCIVDGGLWRNPFLGTVIRSAQYLPNSANAQELLERCAASLRRGQSLLMFAEGSRNVPGKPMKLKRGAAQMALRADAPIVPVAINCVPRTLTKGEKWYKIPATQVVYTITIGDTGSLGVTAPYNDEVTPRALTGRMHAYFQRYVEY